jgi:hypothetical protein
MKEKRITEEDRRGEKKRRTRGKKNDKFGHDPPPSLWRRRSKKCTLRRQK